MGELWGAPQPNAAKSAMAQDDELACKLWETSEELTGVELATYVSVVQTDKV